MKLTIEIPEDYVLAVDHNRELYNSENPDRPCADNQAFVQRHMDEVVAGWAHRAMRQVSDALHRHQDPLAAMAALSKIPRDALAPPKVRPQLVIDQPAV